MASQQCNQPPQTTIQESGPGILLFTFISTISLTLNTAVAVIHAHRDVTAVCSIVGLYMSIVLFYCCVYVYDGWPGTSPKREKHKIPIWGYLTGIQFLYVYRLVPFTPLAWRVFSWVLVACCSLVGLYFFIFRLNTAAAAAADGNKKTSSGKISPVEDV